jgi:hypothetical protein
MHEPHPTPRAPGQGGRGELYLTLIIGILIGASLMMLLGLGLYSQGSLWLGHLPTLVPTVVPPACPATPDLNLVCPTPITPPPTFTLSPLATSTPSPTIDLAETATSACATLEFQFPGTPCPK